MIKDTIKNTIFYSNLNENFKIAFDFLKNTDLTNLKSGKHFIKDEEIFVNIDSYTTKSIDETKFEAHKKYIDIQFMIEGSELIAVSDVNLLKTLTAYDEIKDIEFFKSKKTVQFVELNTNDFVILYPQDAHRPCICNEAPQKIKKAVIKIKL